MITGLCLEQLHALLNKPFDARGVPDLTAFQNEHAFIDGARTLPNYVFVR